jgi:hypothetical protein
VDTLPTFIANGSLVYSSMSDEKIIQLRTLTSWIFCNVWVRRICFENLKYTFQHIVKEPWLIIFGSVRTVEQTHCDVSTKIDIVTKTNDCNNWKWKLWSIECGSDLSEGRGFKVCVIQMSRRIKTIVASLISAYQKNFIFEHTLHIHSQDISVVFELRILWFEFWMFVSFGCHVQDLAHQ